MKKILLILSLVAITSVVFVSCNDKDSDNVDNNNTGTNKIAGTWVLVNSSTKELTECDKKTSFTFEDQGNNAGIGKGIFSMDMNGDGQCETQPYQFTWKTASSENQYTISQPGGQEITINVEFSNDNKTMSFKDFMGINGTVTLHKQ